MTYPVQLFYINIFNHLNTTAQNIWIHIKGNYKAKCILFSNCYAVACICINCKGENVTVQALQGLWMLFLREFNDFVLCVLFDLSVVFSIFAAGVCFGIDSIRYSRLRAGKLVSCQKTEMLSTFVLASFFILYIYVRCFSTWFNSGNRFPTALLCFLSFCYESVDSAVLVWRIIRFTELSINGV